MNISQATKRMTMVLGLLQKSPVFAVGVFASFFVRSLQADGEKRIKRISPRMMWVGIKRRSTGAKSSS